MLTPFRNEPFTDFTIEANAQAYRTALGQVKEQLGRSYPLIIGGERIMTDNTAVSNNPARPQQIVGRFAEATVEHANRALVAASQAFESWRNVPVAERAGYLLKAAAIMRRRKVELSAWLTYEVSKSWVEADGDVAEAIDFCEYYAHQMLRLSGPQPVVPFPNENNELHYIPLGVGVVIPPWNFPLAITVGMTTAAIVAGNTVVLKPAHTSPTIAAKFAEILIDECHLPPGVLNVITGPGGLIGDTLVDHPLTRFIAFTGSKEIGLRIYGRAAVRQPGQNWLKRTILEMGGKDAIVVDETADLDLAAEAITFSAFGFQGQKCSACSRAIIVESVYDEVVQKVVERTRKLMVGDPAEGAFMGAVIDEKAFGKIKEYIEIGKAEGRLLLGGETGDANEGYFIQPTIVADVPEGSRLACEEVFGPVLAVVKARDFEHAEQIFNSTEYGLTGGLISRSRERIERAKHTFHVGNLYFNRKITGALVGVQPFGGFNMSGTDSKAGGPDYLLLFTQPKVITERF
ncbi:MAG: L-glutamate gamma-semialdehyde dehydrogenase [Chloroflexota bacterium]|nr:L-glutamate gamma-semialdehyde dehydrogenase [Chloroflexota bacterium]